MKTWRQFLLGLAAALKRMAGPDQPQQDQPKQPTWDSRHARRLARQWPGPALSGKSTRHQPELDAWIRRQFERNVPSDDEFDFLAQTMTLTEYLAHIETPLGRRELKSRFRQGAKGTGERVSDAELNSWVEYEIRTARRRATRAARRATAAQQTEQRSAPPNPEDKPQPQCIAQNASPETHGDRSFRAKRRASRLPATSLSQNPAVASAKTRTAGSTLPAPPRRPKTVDPSAHGNTERS